MRNLHGSRLILLVAPTLLILFPIGVLTFALERISNALLREHTARDWRGGRFSANNSTDIDIDGRINQAPTISILGICCLSYLVSTIGVAGIWELRKVEGTSSHQRTWSWAVMISHVVMFGASVGVLGWVIAVQSNEESQLQREDLSSGNPTFTRETWACRIDKFYPDSGWAGSACGTARATRFLLIPMAIASALALVSLWVIVQQRGGFRWLSGGKGRYGGFDNVYELQNAPPGGPYAVQPAPQWSPQPHQQWAPMPTHPQWTQQPYQQPLQHPAGHGLDPDNKVNQQPVFR